MTAPQVFISYARSDNGTPPGLDPERDRVKGFVTALAEQLCYWFADLGEPAPALWRDVRIAGGEQFDPVLREEVARSAILLVVLSPNWIRRPWCRQELELFHQQYGDAALSRIVVAHRGSLAPGELDRLGLAGLLPEATGYRFFRRDPETAEDIRFFEGGRIHLREAYDDAAKSLAQYLRRLAVEIIGAQPATPPQPPEPLAAPAAPSRGRTLFLAEPAADMLAARATLHEELTRRGYTVLPAPDQELDREDGQAAIAQVDAALARAELSIHLLGARRGFAPEGAPPIVQMQLERAARRVPVPAEGAAPDPRAFRRLIWAPRLLPGAADGAERDAEAVLAMQAGQPDAAAAHRPGDTLMNDTLARFVAFCIQHLEATARREPPAAGAARAERNGRSVYLHVHPQLDAEAGLAVARSLRGLGRVPLLLTGEGQEAERSAAERAYLRRCDEVVLCWGRASDLWVRAYAAEIADWQGLGRDRAFLRRAVVQLPPASQGKAIFRELPPDTDIDQVVDVTDLPPTVEALAAKLREALGEDAPVPAPGGG